MNEFNPGDVVVTSRKICAGIQEDGPWVCDAGIEGRVLEIERDERDGVHVLLENGMSWWFKPGQLKRAE
jgi:hypothetical protein|tara:strand:- start:32 stop:238 length:207 start_codon:yes stop_codon:yes gene_type:complete